MAFLPSELLASQVAARRPNRLVEQPRDDIMLNQPVADFAERRVVHSALSIARTTNQRNSML